MNASLKQLASQAVLLDGETGEELARDTVAGFLVANEDSIGDNTVEEIEEWASAGMIGDLRLGGGATPVTILRAV